MENTKSTSKIIQEKCDNNEKLESQILILEEELKRKVNCYIFFTLKFKLIYTFSFVYVRLCKFLQYFAINQGSAN